MPNHCENSVLVTGPEKDVAAFEQRCVRPDADDGGKLEFDFNGLIPMPKELKDTTASSDGDVGYEVWHDPDPRKWKAVAAYPWVQDLLKAAGLGTTRANVKAVLAAKDPEYKRQGDRYNRNILEYGVPNWYEWANRNWGTKWNGYGYAEEERRTGLFRFRFTSAWAPPDPVLRAIVEAFPTLRVEYFYSIEGGCGEGSETLVGEKARA